MITKSYEGVFRRVLAYPSAKTAAEPHERARSTQRGLRILNFSIRSIRLVESRPGFARFSVRIVYSVCLSNPPSPTYVCCLYDSGTTRPTLSIRKRLLNSAIWSRNEGRELMEFEFMGLRFEGVEMLYQGWINGAGFINEGHMLAQQMRIETSN